MIRRPPRSTQSRSSAASDVYKRQGFEPLMTKCFAAKSDEEFEAAYKRMVDFATQNQLSDESMAKLNAFYQEKYPESYNVYMDNYK